MKDKEVTKIWIEIEPKKNDKIAKYYSNDRQLSIVTFEFWNFTWKSVMCLYVWHSIIPQLLYI